ncbi:hypothetical protein Ddye_009586 [Dipteronia dyeriana]|uniref:Uncharacterized protein n=1 Tax=Dipteronia dyeriana TaxID=168575 RepID=A0AAD9XBT4_9ROSI|nr:hypothetical protein Ddye_009586 [Dipteronia dyeriana]
MRGGNTQTLQFGNISLTLLTSPRTEGIVQFGNTQPLDTVNFPRHSAGRTKGPYRTASVNQIEPPVDQSVQGESQNPRPLLLLWTRYRNQSRLPRWLLDGQNMIEASGLGLKEMQSYSGEEENFSKME